MYRVSSRTQTEFESSPHGLRPMSDFKVTTLEDLVIYLDEKLGNVFVVVPDESEVIE